MVLAAQTNTVLNYVLEIYSTRSGSDVMSVDTLVAQAAAGELAGIVITLAYRQSPLFFTFVSLFLLLSAPGCSRLCRLGAPGLALSTSFSPSELLLLESFGEGLWSKTHSVRVPFSLE